ncbi:hypothetical protein ACWCQX_50635, partial [Streptomyces sp. NPDC002346]
ARTQAGAMPEGVNVNLDRGYDSAKSRVLIAELGFIGIICGLSTGILSWAGGANMANSVLRGGASLGGVLVIGIALLTALNSLK